MVHNIHGLGNVELLARPQIIVMVDRADGTEWQLTHRQSDNRWALRDDPVPHGLRGQVRRFEAFDGPRLGAHPEVRLLIRDGRLGYEIAPLGQGVRDLDTHRVCTRRGLAAYSLEVIPAGWSGARDTLGWIVALGVES